MFPVPRILEDIVEAICMCFKKGHSGRPWSKRRVPRATDHDGIADATQLLPQEGMQDQNVVQTAYFPVPQNVEVIAKVQSPRAADHRGNRGGSFSPCRRSQRKS